jgi:hypothetical protein
MSANVVNLAEYRSARAQRCGFGNPDYGATAQAIAARARRIGTFEELDSAVDEILDMCEFDPHPSELLDLAKALKNEADALLLREMLDTNRAMAAES